MNSVAQKTHSQLTQRRRPVQERSVKRVERILDATASIVKEDGFTKLTTNLIAQRAGIPVGTIYQFFPNKSAILAALEQRVADKVNNALDNILERDSSNLNLIDELIDKMARIWKEEEAVMLNWHALRMEPQFATVEEESFREVAERNERLMKKIGIRQPQNGLLIGSLLQETISAQLDFRAKLPERAQEAALKELKRMMRSYLKSHLSPAKDR